VGWCGDGLCSGGVDPNPDPQKQVYPGHISVPLGCQCRTCGGGMIMFVGFADDSVLLSKMRLFSSYQHGQKGYKSIQ